MPHFRHIDYDNLSNEEALLMRARLHIRGGKTRLREGRISLGILTLYDALNTAMQWYISSPDNRKKLRANENDNLKQDDVVAGLLSRAGIFRQLDYNELNRLVDDALKKDMSSFDYSGLLERIDAVMTQLGVMPFDEADLPPDDTDKT